MDCVIYHYEDEHFDIPYPSLLEIGFRRNSARDCSIESDDERGEHVISFSLNGTRRSLRYLFLATDFRLEPPQAQAAVLHVIDVSIDGDRTAGFGILERLLSMDVDTSNIWLMTGYPYQARQKVAELGLPITVLPKPGRHADIRDQMLQRVLARIGEQEAA